MRFHLPKFSRPSTGTILGAVALFVALGGTALAATGTLVNITDPSHSTYVAKVSSRGELKTTQVPGSPFTHFAIFPPGDLRPIMAPTSATLAFSRIGFTNSSAQTGGATAHVTLYEWASDGGSVCTNAGSSATLATYEIKAGQTVLDALPTSMVLKPLSGHAYWCLVAYATLNPYSSPGVSLEASLNGSIVSGSFPTYASKRLFPKIAGKPPGIK